MQADLIIFRTAGSSPGWFGVSLRFLYDEELEMLSTYNYRRREGPNYLPPRFLVKLCLLSKAGLFLHLIRASPSFPSSSSQRQILCALPLATPGPFSQTSSHGFANFLGGLFGQEWGREGNCNAPESVK